MNKDKVEDILVLVTSVLVCVGLIGMCVGIYLDSGDIVIWSMFAAVVVTLVYSLIMSVLD